MAKAMSDKKMIKRAGADKALLERFKEIRSETISEAKKISDRKNRRINVLGVSGSARLSDRTVQSVLFHDECALPFLLFMLSERNAIWR